MINSVGLVIFDCDGVLVDSEPIAIRVHVALGAEHGWPLTPADVIERFVGRSSAAIAEQIAERVGPDVAAEWTRGFEARHRDEVDAGLSPVEGIEYAVDTLADLGLPTCVASSGSHDKMAHTLGRTGLHDRFAGRIFSATEVAHGKPAPDVFLHAAARMGVSPEHCVVVEDSLNGLRAARAAGMRSFAYAGDLVPSHLLEGPTTTVFKSMRDLPALITDMR
ncbi:haloacid dehalogenase [Embleya scabrispora]|uniref:Haloacid dehalogenase n=1 Tax=Embleya scabrispora TaxID=159449 RepID=A0A1T3P8K2_9ACTN|nr:HAD family hydrolase [Embleya scabrispora]OPC85408.1 haloacid dehalogenase [Embleya scabrispora]